MFIFTTRGRPGPLQAHTVPAFQERDRRKVVTFVTHRLKGEEELCIYIAERDKRKYLAWTGERQRDPLKKKTEWDMEQTFTS